MDHVNRVSEGDRIDSAVGSTPILGRNFHHAAAEAMQRLGFGAHFAHLRGVQRIADVILDSGRKRLHVERESASHVSFFMRYDMPILA